MEIEDFFLTKLDFSKVSSDLADREKSLKEKRWFDYRGASFEILTLFFLATYVKVFREYLAKVDDVVKAVDAIPYFIEVVDGVPTLNSDDTVMLVEARQVVDGIGCRYGFYIRSAFQRIHDFGWHYIPNLKDLAEMTAEMDIAAKWDECKQKTLQLGNPSVMSDSVLSQYHQFLMDYVNSRPSHLRKSVIDRLTKEGHLPKMGV